MSDALEQAVRNVLLAWRGGLGNGAPPVGSDLERTLRALAFAERLDGASRSMRSEALRDALQDIRSECVRGVQEVYGGAPDFDLCLRFDRIANRAAKALEGR